MKKLYVRIIIGLIAVILTLVFGTGAIMNCESPGEVYTSYFSFNTKHEKDYQALYFSQTKGIFYGIYGRMDLTKDKKKIKGMFLKSINYRRTLPFTFRVGFHSNILGDSLLYAKDSVLRFDMVLDRLGTSKSEAYVKLAQPESIDSIFYFYVRRYYDEDNIGDEIDDPCEGQIGTAIGLNCIESKLQVVR